jgi:enoyl-CoA hydratase
VGLSHFRVAKDIRLNGMKQSQQASEAGWLMQALTCALNCGIGWKYRNPEYAAGQLLSEVLNSEFEGCVRRRNYVRYSKYSALKIELRDRVLRVTLDNPPLNSITRQMHQELSTLFYDINADDQVAVVVVTGAGDRAFSAGGDIKAMAERIEKGNHGLWLTGANEMKNIIRGLLQLERPLIARINGHAMGLGATLALFSDFSYMIEKAKIADTHVKVGLSAGDGGSMMWPLLIGLTKARKHLLTGEPLLGKEAAKIGLVTESASTLGELDEKVDRMTERLASGASVAINATKVSINLVLRRMLDSSIETHLGLETQSYLSKDHLEAVTAFRDGKTPQFSGS